MLLVRTSVFLFPAEKISKNKFTHKVINKNIYYEQKVLILTSFWQKAQIKHSDCLRMT